MLWSAASGKSAAELGFIIKLQTHVLVMGLWLRWWSIFITMGWKQKWMFRSDHAQVFAALWTVRPIRVFSYVFNTSFTCFCHILLHSLNNDQKIWSLLSDLLNSFLVGRDPLFCVIYSELEAYLKVGLCPTAAADGAVGAQPVAPGAWNKNENTSDCFSCSCVRRDITEGFFAESGETSLTSSLNKGTTSLQRVLLTIKGRLNRHMQKKKTESETHEAPSKHLTCVSSRVKLLSPWYLKGYTLNLLKSFS